MHKIDRDEVRRLYDAAVNEIGRNRPDIDLTTGFYAETGNSVFEAGHIALTDYTNCARRLNVVSAPSGGGKTTFAFALMVAMTRYAERHPDSPAGCVLVVEQIAKADAVYRELNALMPGKVAIWTSEHDPKCRERERVQNPAAQFRANDLCHFPIIVVTHKFYSGPQGKQAQDWARDGDVFWQSRRALTIVDERPEEVEIYETTVRQAYAVREIVADRLPEISEHMERLILFMLPHDLDARNQKLRVPGSESVTREALAWFASDQADRVVRTYASSIPGIEPLFGFARAMSLGCAFAVPNGNLVDFIGWQPKFIVQPGMMLLDATADIDGVSQVVPWREHVDTPRATYENLEIVHVPQHTTHILKNYFEKAKNMRRYVASMVGAIKANMQPGERGLVVCKKALLDQEQVPNWGPGDPKFDDPASYTERFEWDIEGRKLCAINWGTGIGANAWRDADVVFLFDEFFIPRAVAAATVQGLRGHRADEGDMASMTTIRSKAAGVDLIGKGHRLRWIKQLALRGRGRQYDSQGVCGKQRLVVSCDHRTFLANAQKLFPGANITMKEGAKSGAGKTTKVAQLIQVFSRPGLPSKVSAAEIGKLIGRPWRDVSYLVTDDLHKCLEAIGWRYVQGRGRAGSYFERIPEKLPLAA